jgi:small multidrug resistance pump
MNWLYLFLAILGEVIGATALKSSNGFTRFGPGVLVLAGYAVAFFFLALTLRTIPIGVAYAIWSGVGTALIVVMAYVFYKQKPDLAALIGIGLIICVVAVINIFSKTAAGR